MICGASALLMKMMITANVAAFLLLVVMTWQFFQMVLIQSDGCDDMAPFWEAVFPSA
jgi:hypothetical protein